MDPVMRNTSVKVLEGYLGNENPVLNQVIERYRHKIPGREANEVVRFSVLEACIPALPNTNSGKDRLLSVELANKPAQSTAR